MFNTKRALTLALTLSIVTMNTPIGVLAAENTDYLQNEQSVLQEDLEAEAETAEDETVEAADEAEDVAEETPAEDAEGEEPETEEDPSVEENMEDAEPVTSEAADSVASEEAGTGETDTEQASIEEPGVEGSGTEADGTEAADTEEAGAEKTTEVAKDAADLELRTDTEELYFGIVNVDLGDTDELFETYANSLFYPVSSSAGNRRKLAKVSAGSHLTDNDLVIYTAMKERAEAVANGESDNIRVEIPFTDLGIEDRMYSANELGLTEGQSLIDELTGKLSDDAKTAIMSMLSYDYNKVVNSLRVDCAYELYWSTGGFGHGSMLSYSYNSVGVNFSYSTAYFTMYVDSAYRQSSGDETSVDTSKTSAAGNAADTASQIVEEAAAMSDPDKLYHYKESICDLVSYDTSAAANPSQSDKSPWALINVFDGDPDTNVVCEGYSEAFQYLGSLTDFDSSTVSVYSVSGIMSGGTGSGGHKWNIVRMNDNKNYIADITNSDEGTIGEDGRLFLTGMGGNINDGYHKAWEERQETIDNGDGTSSIITYPACQIDYEYYSDMFDIYTAEELTLSDTDYNYVEPDPGITSQPADVEAQVGETVEFTVEADGSDLQYQWQWSADGNTWKNCTGGSYDTDTFSFVMQERFADRHYRCIVTAGELVMTSEAATVSLVRVNRIVKQPKDAEAGLGDTVEFYVEASGSDISYQWQYSVNGTYWSDCKSGDFDTDTFSFTMQSRFAGRYYRCVVIADGETMISNAASVSLVQKVTIAADPEDVEAAVGDTVEFYVGAVGNNVSYQWQYSINGTYWSDCKGDSYNTDTFSFVMQEKFDGRRYRCKVTSGAETKISGAAVLSVLKSGEITSQPEDAEVALGDTAEFHVGFTGNDPVYQWQYSLNGTYWSNCKSGSYNTDTFSFAMQEKFAGRSYRCVITADGVTYTSDSATVSLPASDLITSQPVDLTVRVGESVAFHVEAEGTDLSYQWQWSSNGSTWKNCTGSSYNTDTFSFTAQTRFSGRMYRCVVTDGTETAYSECGVLTVTE